MDDHNCEDYINHIKKNLNDQVLYEVKMEKLKGLTRQKREQEELFIEKEYKNGFQAMDQTEKFQVNIENYTEIDFFTHENAMRVNLSKLVDPLQKSQEDINIKMKNIITEIEEYKLSVNRLNLIIFNKTDAEKSEIFSRFFEKVRVVDRLRVQDNVQALGQIKQLNTKVDDLKETIQNEIYKTDSLEKVQNQLSQQMMDFNKSSNQWQLQMTSSFDQFKQDINDQFKQQAQINSETDANFFNCSKERTDLKNLIRCNTDLITQNSQLISENLQRIGQLKQTKLDNTIFGEFVVKLDEQLEKLSQTVENNTNHFAMVENFIEKYQPVQILKLMNEVLENVYTPQLNKNLNDYYKTKLNQMHGLILLDKGHPNLIDKLRTIRYDASQLDFGQFESKNCQHVCQKDQKEIKYQANSMVNNLSSFFNEQIVMQASGLQTQKQALNSSQKNFKKGMYRAGGLDGVVNSIKERKKKEQEKKEAYQSVESQKALSKKDSETFPYDNFDQLQENTNNMEKPSMIIATMKANKERIEELTKEHDLLAEKHEKLFEFVQEISQQLQGFETSKFAMYDQKFNTQYDLIQNEYTNMKKQSESQRREIECYFGEMHSQMDKFMTVRKDKIQSNFLEIQTCIKDIEHLKSQKKYDNVFALMLAFIVQIFEFQKQGIQPSSSQRIKTQQGSRNSTNFSSHQLQRGQCKSQMGQRVKTDMFTNTDFDEPQPSEDSSILLMKLQQTMNKCEIFKVNNLSSKRINDDLAVFIKKCKKDVQTSKPYESEIKYSAIKTQRIPLLISGQKSSRFQRSQVFSKLQKLSNLSESSN